MRQSVGALLFLFMLALLKGGVIRWPEMDGLDLEASQPPHVLPIIEMRGLS